MVKRRPHKIMSAMQIIKSKNARTKKNKMKKETKMTIRDNGSKTLAEKDGLYKDRNDKALDIVVNNVDLMFEFVWKWREIKEIEHELGLEMNQDEKIQKELNVKLKKTKKNYHIYLKELVDRKILPEEWKLSK